jgi:phosphoribosylformimino-5-aminoimidazole carboxamide ribotide isomerase
MTFTIYPAIDLRNGRVVRLQYGDPEKETVFGDDPAAMGQKWIEAGTQWLHVVNLDGAFDEKGSANWAALPQITQLDARVQFGGGIRALADVERALDAGVTRVIMGTVAIENPDLVTEAITQFGADKIVVGIDARHGEVKTRGWVQGTGTPPADLGKQMKERGVQTIIYTDISRDGVLTGVNAEATAKLAQATGLNVIASGGVATLADITNCHTLADQGVSGVITGRAIYDGRIDLAEAFATLKNKNQMKASPAPVEISLAKPEDSAELVRILKAAFMLEAIRYNKFDIPPLLETVENFAASFADLTIYKAEQNGKIVGSVNTRVENGTCYIGRLIVDPEYHNQGIGKQLMTSAEADNPQVTRFELFTGYRSEKNIKFYEKQGYTIYAQKMYEEDFGMVYLEKFQ